MDLLICISYETSGKLLGVGRHDIQGTVSPPVSQKHMKQDPETSSLVYRLSLYLQEQSDI